jgi:hypothetical protein
MVNGFLNVASVFLLLLCSSPSGIEKHARLCMQFADSGGNIAAGALSRTKTHSFCTLRISLLFLEMSTKVGIVSCTRHIMQALLLRI